jgi:hypothetical protein
VVAWVLHAKGDNQLESNVRYLIAIVVAGLLIGGAAFFVRQTFRDIMVHVRQALRNQKEAGILPPELRDVDIEAAVLPDMVISLPASLQRRLQLAYWATDFWYVWAPLTVVSCLGLAFVLFRKPIEN